MGSRRVVTPHGTVRAEHVVLATEGYTPTVAGRRRAIAPIYSLMTATEPLPDAIWAADRAARQRTTFADNRHLTIYGQRTRDGRIAFGGRGAPYHYASKVSPPTTGTTACTRCPAADPRSSSSPSSSGVTFTHAWGGNLGVPRDWFPSVRHDRHTGLAFAGGYVGDGVATSALAGRTLAAMIRDDDPDDLASLALGGAHVTQLGAGAAAVARGQRRHRPHDLRRLVRASHRPAVARGVGLLDRHRPVGTSA